MEELLTMTTREIDRLRIIRQVLEHKLKWHEAAEQLRLSVRQIARVCVRVHTDGNKGIIHRLRAHPSNHRLDPKLLKSQLNSDEIIPHQRHGTDTLGKALARHIADKRTCT